MARSRLKKLGVQRAVAEHARTARDANHTRAAFIAQRSSEHLESLVAQRLEAELCPALPTVQRQADLTLSHVADHFGSKAAVQLARDPERLSSYAGFKNAGAGLVKNFRTTGSSHTIPELASAIQRFRDPMQRAAVEGAVYAAFGSHPTYPKQLQRALEGRDQQLEVQRESWQRELEPVAQRQALEEMSGEGAAQQIESARGGGQPLPAGVRTMLEAKWNTDLSMVRVHTNSSAAAISKKLNAKALTTGQDIFFGASTFNPTSLEGLQLIAHEAWHTVQQAGGLVQAGIDRSQSLEIEARGKGAEVSSGDVQTASSSAGLKTKTSRTPKPATAARTSSATKVTQRAVDTTTPAPSSGHSTSTRQIGNLEGLISSTPIFGAPVQRAADGTVIQRAWWNPFDWAAEGAKWLGAKFMDGLEFLGEKGAKAFMEVFTAAAKPFGATGKHVLEALKGIGKSLLQVIANPGAFASNLIAGVKLGFGNFVTNAPQHLTGILGSWLGGNGIDLKFPTKLEPLPMLMALLSSLHLGWDSIRAKIAKQLGPKGNQAVALAEKSVPMISSLSGGLHKNADFTKAVMPTLKTEAVDGLKTAAQEGLIRAGINVLLKLIPGAGTISAIFDTVGVLVSKASAIASLVTSVTGSFAAIAAGNLSSAAVAIEKSLSGGMRVALDFVAKLAKVDTFIARVRGIIERVTTKVSSVADPIIARAVKLIRPLLNKLGGKGDPKATAKHGLKDGRYGEESFTAGKEPHRTWLSVASGKPTVMIASVEKPAKEQLDGWRDEAVQKGLQAQVGPYIGQGMTIVNRAVKNLNKAASTTTVDAVKITQMWKSDGKAIARVVKVIRDALGPEVNYAFVTDSSGVKRTKLITISFLCPKNLSQAGFRGEFSRQVEGQQTGLNKLSVPEWFTNRSSFLSAGRSNKEQQRYRQLNKADWVDAKTIEIQTRPYTQGLLIQLRKVISSSEISILQDTAVTPRIPAARAKAIAGAIWSKQAALHGPDQNAGGFASSIDTVGDGDVNSAIGSQWKERIYLIDREVAKVPAVLRPDLKINTRLRSQ